MESNRTEHGKPVEIESQQTLRGEQKKPMTPSQIGIWTIGILAGFSALFLLLSLFSPGSI